MLLTTYEVRGAEFSFTDRSFFFDALYAETDRQTDRQTDTMKG